MTLPAKFSTHADWVTELLELMEEIQAISDRTPSLIKRLTESHASLEVLETARYFLHAQAAYLGDVVDQELRNLAERLPSRVERK